MQQDVATWKYFSGLVRMDVHGTSILACLQQKKDIWKFSSGLARMVVHGMQVRARPQKIKGIWKCWSGHVPMIARNEGGGVCFVFQVLNQEKMKTCLSRRTNCRLKKKKKIPIMGGSLSSIPEKMADNMKRNQMEAMEAQRRMMQAQLIAVTRERVHWFGGAWLALASGLMAAG